MSGREKIWKQGDPPANWRACDHAHMSKLVLLSALVLACGGGREAPTNEQPAPTPSEETAVATEPEPARVRVNRSAGPARARFSVMPVQSFDDVDALATSGRFLVVGGSRGMVAIYDVPSGHVRAARRVFGADVGAVLMAGQHLLITGRDHGDGDACAAMWDLETDQVWRVPGSVGEVEDLALSPDGSRYALLVSDEELTLAMGSFGVSHQQTLTFHVSDGIPSVAFSEDGTEVVVTSRTVQRFDARTGRSRGTPAAVETPEPAAVETAPDAGEAIELDAEGVTLNRGDAEPVRFEFGRRIERSGMMRVARPRRGSHFFVGADSEVFIANVERQRMRRLVQGGRRPFDLWDVKFAERGFRIGTASMFGIGPASSFDPNSAQFASRPGASLRLTDPEGHDETLLLEVRGRPAVPLEIYASCFSVPRDRHEGDEYEWLCTPSAEFAADGSSLVVRGNSEATDQPSVTYDMSGRQTGRMEDAYAQYSPDGTRLVVRRRNGSVVLSDASLNVTSTVMRARPDVESEVAFNDSGSLLAVTRGTALVVYEVETDTRRFAVTMPGTPRFVAPHFVDDRVRVQIGNQFVWYSLADGSETRRLELANLRGATDVAAVHCDESRLMHRVLESEQSHDLGPCPLQVRVSLDDERVWWTDRSQMTFVRVADAQRLRAGVVRGLEPLRYAYTPEGKVWVSSRARLGALRTRAEGPVLEAELGEVTEAMLTDELIENFMTGAPL